MHTIPININSSKKAYHQFCKSEKELPIFFQDWYLDAVCYKGEWAVIILKENNTIVAVLPYFLKKKMFFKYITMPQLNFMMGPYIAKAFRDKVNSSDIIEQLYNNLPTVQFLFQRLHYSIKEFTTQHTIHKRYSYIIPDLSDLEKVYQNITSKYRNNKITKAKKIVHIKEDLDLASFYKVNKMSFDRQGIAVPYSFELMKRLDQALQKNKAGKIFYAIDDLGQIHSVAYLIWDKRSSYYLIGGDDPNLRKSGSGILLSWEAIRYTQEKLGLNIFDFEGSMIPNVERVRKDFGATRKYYLAIESEESFLFKIGKKIKNILHF